MTDDSKFVIRWEINNARARLAVGKVESRVFHEGGFKWSAIVRRERNDDAAVILKCGVDDNVPWKCEADISTWCLDRNGEFHSTNTREERIVFDETNYVSKLKSHIIWYGLSTDQLFNLNNKVTIEFRIHVISSDRGEPISFIFAAPNNRSDVILVIGENKLHVNKEYLAVQSPFFETMFFGDFAEKGKDEVEIKDVIYEEFHDLLQLIYHEKELSDRTVLHILKLADRFQMKVLINKAESYLIQSIGFENKLQIADQYRLAKLRDHCLRPFTSPAELIQKSQSVEWAGFSDESKLAIRNRIMMLKWMN